MALIKSLTLDQTKIEFYDDYIPKNQEEKKKNLIEIYDVINEIATKLDCKKTKAWFLTKKQIETMKKSGGYNFL